MPITADILRRLQPQPRPQDILNLDPPQQSPFLKVPNSALLSKITRGNPEPIAPSAPSVNPNLEMRPNHDPNSGLALPSPQPDTSALEPLSNPKFDPTLQPGRSLLDVLKNSSPRSRVYQTPEGVREDAPTPMGHGFWNRLKKVGEGAVIGMGQIAKQNAQSGREQTLESLLGGGAAGGVVGGVNPLSIDVLRRQNQIGQAEQDQFRQGELDKQRAETQHLKNLGLPEPAKPVFKERENADGSTSTMRSDDGGKTWSDIPDLTSRPPAKASPERPAVYKDFKNTDGSVVVKRSTDNGKTWESVEGLGAAAPPAKPAKESGLTPYQQKERQAKAAALAGKIDSARKDAAAAINAATAEQDATKKAEWIQKYRNALTDGTAAATELQQGYGDLYEAGAGASDMKGVNTQGEQWPYYKPKAQTAGATSGVSGAMRPSKDGKYHYTLDQIRTAAGPNFDSVYAKLKANPKVVIE